jgi:hypothetical protein
VDEDEVTAEEAAEDQVEMNGGGCEARKEDGQRDGGEEDSGEEEGAVTVVEVVAGFEIVRLGGRGVHLTCIHETIGGVEHPDGDGHGEDGGDREAEMGSRGDEPGPENGYGGGIEGEKMPEAQDRVGEFPVGVGLVAVLLGLDWSRGGHMLILGVWLSEGEVESDGVFDALSVKP